MHRRYFNESKGTELLFTSYKGMNFYLKFMPLQIYIFKYYSLGRRLFSVPRFSTQICFQNPLSHPQMVRRYLQKLIIRQKFQALL